ncbi:MAG TPA: hypothetical protein VFU07_08035 [Candidatus Lumbricidophila sp.]|nr:hypothetical protein [Candidatus Lumbricidophila sp.]
MGFFDRLFGNQQPVRPEQTWPPVPPQAPGAGAGTLAYSGAGAAPAPMSEDQRAIARYRYLLRTAPPEAIEQAHAEAFAALTPAQRQQVLVSLQADAPANERPTADDPASLARAATRQELRQPGSLERSFGRPGMGFGSMVASSMLGTIAGVVIGTAIADMLTPDSLVDAGAADAGSVDADAADADASGTDAGATDAAADTGGDWGSEAAGGDFGGWGGSGGDWGGSGGDFGGGDFGGDFGGF